MFLIKTANLYVEKYDSENLLLDFIREDEFYYFRNNGDYSFSRKYLPVVENTILFFKNVPDLKLKEGDIVSIPMNILMEYRRSNNSYSSEEPTPNNVFTVFENSSWLFELFQSGMAYKNNGIGKIHTHEIKETFGFENNCALNNITNELSVEVLDVGEGSANLIYNEYCTAIFDFGASILFSESKLKTIVEDIKNRFNGLYSSTLIISHWHLDHYNLITALETEDLKNFDCVILPSKVISLTSKRVAKLIEDNCVNIKTIKPKITRYSAYFGMEPVIWGSKYILYAGPKVKDVNKSGLALVVKSAKEMTVLGADHNNEQIWNEVYKHAASVYGNLIVNVVVPHHGGNCGKIDIKEPDFKSKFAAISVGKNSYKHPQQSTIDMYKKLGFKVERTDWERKNLLINMK